MLAYNEVFFVHVLKIYKSNFIILYHTHMMQ